MLSGARRGAETLQVRLLGGLEVVRGCVQRPLPASRKTRGLIAYLALARARAGEKIFAIYFGMMFPIPGGNCGGA